MAVTGTLVACETGPLQASVLGDSFELRCLFENWKAAFVKQVAGSGRSWPAIQVLGPTGTECLTVESTEETDLHAYWVLLSRALAAPGDPIAAGVERSLVARIHPLPPVGSALRSAWDVMGGPAGLPAVAARFGLPHARLFRLVGSDRARRVSRRSAERTLRAIVEAGTPVSLFVGNGGAHLRWTGRLMRFQPTRGSTVMLGRGS